MAKRPVAVPMPAKRTIPEDAARQLEAAAESRQARPAGSAIASSQARPTAPLQAQEGTADDGRSVRRKRGAWTKAEPYTKRDGTATRGTTVYLPVELAERLRRYAFEQETKQNAVMIAALADYLERAGA